MNITNPFLNRLQLEEAGVFSLYQQLFDVLVVFGNVFVASYGAWDIANGFDMERDLRILALFIDHVMVWDFDDDDCEFDVVVGIFYNQYKLITQRLMHHPFNMDITVKLWIHKSITVPIPLELQTPRNAQFLTPLQFENVYLSASKSLEKFVDDLKKAIFLLNDAINYLVSQRSHI